MSPLFSMTVCCFTENNQGKDLSVYGWENQVRWQAEAVAQKGSSPSKGSELTVPLPRPNAKGQHMCHGLHGLYKSLLSDSTLKGG